MSTDNQGPESPDLEAPATGLKTLTSYADAELLEALDDACQHIAGKAWTVTALAQECIRRANERNDAA